ncbi:hypothetical protein, partial [Halorubrum lacusprofundi]|uniref:hypothetical protein n=1 Tax=Halorubrum lacusprofundi TaxID=2247 RepID=UPI001A8DC95B
MVWREDREDRANAVERDRASDLDDARRAHLDHQPDGDDRSRHRPPAPAASPGHVPRAGRAGQR